MMSNQNKIQNGVIRLVYPLYLIIFLCFTSLNAQASDDAHTFLFGFLDGNYEIIGRQADSDSVYTGRMTLTPADSGFNVIRLISGKTTKGRAVIGSALRGEETVLRMSFIRNSIPFEATFLIDSDLDNYPRLSGYVYSTKKTTIIPGIETCFFVPQR